MGIAFGIVCFVLIIAAIVAIAVAVEQSTHTFVCRNCGKEFKPKWTQLVFEAHIFDEHVMKCPFCNIKDFCGDKGKNNGISKKPLPIFSLKLVRNLHIK